MNLPMRPMFAVLLVMLAPSVLAQATQPGAGDAPPAATTQATQPATAPAATGPAVDPALLERIGNRWGDVSADTAGWEEEVSTLTYEQFRSSDVVELGLPKSLRILAAAEQWMRFESVRKAREEFGEATGVRAIVGRVMGAREAAAQKVAAKVGELIDAAEARGPTPADLARWTAFSEDVKAKLAGTQAVGPLMERVESLRTKWQAELAAAEAARRELAERLTAEAEQRWPELVARFAPEAIEARAAAQEIDKHRGRYVALTGVRDLGGTEFARRDFDLVTPPSGGLPYAARFDEGLRARVAEVAGQTGYELRGASDLQLVGVIEGVTELEVREYHKGLEQWRPIGNVQVPVLRVVAIRSGPIAVGIHLPSTQPATGPVTQPATQPVTQATTTQPVGP